MDNSLDQRQLKQMKLLIERLQSRRIAVSKFVTDQWALIEQLKNVDSAWMDEYNNHVNTIEDLYAAYADQGNSKMPEADTQTLEATLKTMVQSLDSILS